MDKNNISLVFHFIGTKGDIFPIVQICRRLSSDGYDCHVMSNLAHASLFIETDIRFYGVCKEMSNNLIGVRRTLDEYMFSTYEETFRIIDSISRKRRVVLFNQWDVSPTNMYAEAKGVPLVSLVLSPWMLSAERELNAYASFVPWFQRPLLLMSSTLSKFNPINKFVLKKLNYYRQLFGLDRFNDSSEITCNSDMFIALYPEWFEIKGFSKSSVKGVIHCGFQNISLKGLGMSPEFSDKLRSLTCKKTVLFTPGTATQDVDQFFEVAERVCRALELNGVFLSPYAAQRENYDSRNIVVSDFEPLEDVLEYCDLIVHHGGVGTIARSVAMGVPQIVCPIMHDQPDNAIRIIKLGLGTAIAKNNFTQKVLSRKILDVLGSDLVRRQVGLAKSEQAAVDSTESAVDSIKEFCRSVVTNKYNFTNY